MKSSPLTQAAHAAVAAGSYVSYLKFKEALKNPEGAQRQVLNEILQSLAGTRVFKERKLDQDATWESFAKKIPVSDYLIWKDAIEEQRTKGGDVLAPDCRRFQPTSGSRETLKWIPYPKKFLEELDRAASPWVVDLMKTYPRINRGRHFWSLSWLPENLRQSSATNDDLEVFPFWKQWLMAKVMAVDGRVAFAKTSESALVATLAHLISCEDLTFISVWSPTFIFSMLEALALHQGEVRRILETGRWGLREKDLNNVRCPRSSKNSSLLATWNGTVTADFLRELWPMLELISSWDSASSEISAQRLKGFFPQAKFQGKGLWATEGAVTIPFEGRQVLALRSHFFEFKCLDTDRIFPSWKVRPGQHVQPLLTTGSGLLRYKLEDHLIVEQTHGPSPSFRFLGRLDGVDLVGEKISSSFASDVLVRLKGQKINPLSLFAVSGSENRKYVMLCHGDGLSPKELDDLSFATEKTLGTSFHYRQARELRQLESAAVVVRKDAYQIYEKFRMNRGMILGNIKLESLHLISEGEIFF